MEKQINLNLVSALDRIKTTTKEEDRNWLVFNLANSNLVLPVSVDTVPDANGQLPENTHVKYFSIKNTDGDIYLVTFSNVDYFQEWQKDVHKYHVIYSYEQVKNMVTREGSGFAGIIIDPNHSNVAFRNETLTAIANSLPRDLEVKTERIVTENNIGLLPAENPPEKLMNALTEFMGGYKSILSAHMMQTFRKGDEVPTLIIVLDFLGSAQRVFDDVARVAQDNMDTPQPIGIMPAFDKVVSKYIKDVEPFYTKSKNK